MQPDNPPAPMNPGDEAPPDTPGAGEDLCQACRGTGKVEGRRCTLCSGTGKVLQGIGGG
jgi:RecJ-like exonuclease